jgi:hypothetical protein
MLKVSPAMQVGVSDPVWFLEGVVDLLGKF